MRNTPPAQPPLEIGEILEQFESSTNGFPKAAVEAAVARREEITPELLRILENTAEHGAQVAETDSLVPIYAMYLLAQFREVRAYPLVLRIALLPSRIQERLLGEFVTEGLGRVLASVCGGDLGGIHSLIENESADEWARGAGLDALVSLVAAGEKAREEIVEYFAGLFRGKLRRKPSQVWNMLALNSSLLYPEELLADIEKAFERDLIEPGFIGMEDIERSLSLGRGRTLAELTGGSSYQLVSDTVQEMSWWACFQEDRRTPTPVLQPPKVPTQVKNAQPKVGRNDPCPCGSGKKYKKCCGA